MRLETYRPNVVTEIYADDGQLVGSFALQRRILMTWEQTPKVLYNAVCAIEDQHFEDHWGVDFPRVAGAAYRNILKRRKAEGASTITMQLAGNLFLDRSDRSFRRKAQEMLLGLQIERRYTKPQIFTMYANQVYLAHGNYGFAAAAEFYFGKSVTDLNLQEAALLAGMVNGPKYSPLNNPSGALTRRNLVIHQMMEEGKITPAEEAAARKTPLGLHIQYPRNDLAPYFFEEIRKYLESTYGTEAVHERGLRVYTTLNIQMQKAANQSIRDGLHTYDRRHGWRDKLPNVIKDNLGKLDTYEDDDWRHADRKGKLHHRTDSCGRRQERDRENWHVPRITFAGRYCLDRPQEAYGDSHRWRSRAILRFRICTKPRCDCKSNNNPLRRPRWLRSTIPPAKSKPWLAATVSKIPNSIAPRRPSGRLAVHSNPMFTPTAIEKGSSPFDTIVDAPFTTISGGQVYSPHNYDEKFEGTITLRRALAGSRNVPAVKLAEKVGINSIIDMARRFGITAPLPPYLPLALGAADMQSDRARFGIHGVSQRRHPHRSAHDSARHKL